MESWIIAVIVLIVISLVLLTFLLSIISDIRSISRQLKFIRSNNTNKRITFYGRGKLIRTIGSDINSLLDTTQSKYLDMYTQDQAIRDTITNMSHDIRTPLTSLKGYIELLENAENESEREKYLRIIKSRIDALENILEMMFLYNKANDIKYLNDVDTINLSSLLLEGLFSYYEDLTESGFEVTPDIQENVFIIGNENAINRIIQNLIKNTLVHGSKKLNVTLSVVEVQGNKMVQMIFENMFKSNHIPDMEKVFDRFYKGDDSRAMGSSGIGLSIVKKIVDSSKGNIEATVVDNLFRITITLPNYSKDP